ncbi:MAG: LacI family transcriptional regulator [Erysipelotrichaceae bacterium]|nr:LacI family transcriptional regulator [Erysipelotrichaceae bacterium]
MKRVTIYDVAKEANVSLATVSRVVNGSDVVKQPTREKVEEAINRLGYKPNAVAQGLALSKTTTIGMVITDASVNYTGQIINGVLDAAKIKNYNIVMHAISAGITDINDIIETIIKSRVDGVIIYNDKIDVSELQEVSKYNIPIVFIGNKTVSENVGSVYVDIESVAKEAVSMFLKRGINDVCVLQERHNKHINDQMISGAKKAFKEYKLQNNGYLEIPSEYETSYDFLFDYLKTRKTKALIVHRDAQALAAINAAKENGIKVPEELEVVCILDTKYNLMTRPQISSFSLPSYDLGSIAMASIEKMLNEQEEGKAYELSYFFVSRQSSK